MGHDLQRYSPSHPLQPNKNKNKFKKKKEMRMLTSVSRMPPANQITWWPCGPEEAELFVKYMMNS